MLGTMADGETDSFDPDKSQRIPPYNMEDPLLPLEPRGPWACLAWAILVVAMNAVVLLLNLLLMAAVFAIVLLPTIVVVYFGFQCHSRVLHSSASYCQTLLDDGSSSALIVLGFLLLSPLVVAAVATYCGLARRLCLFACFQPCARAVYKGARWRWQPEGQGAWGAQVKAWV